VRLDRNGTVLVIIDVQERLIPVIEGAEDVIRNLDRLIRGTDILAIPTLVTEQYVKGLGPTVAPVREALEACGRYRPFEKLSFSACGEEAFTAALRELGRPQVLLAGVETHVCVYQTALDLLAMGHEVHLVADAAASRTASNREIALRRLMAEGARLTSTEMALFELLAVSGTSDFRAISRLVK
jgi:nicotinamidase-related amidase